MLFFLHMFAVVSGVVSTSTVNLFFSENPIMSIETSSYNLLENSNHFFAIAVVGAAARAAAGVQRLRSLVLARFSRLS
jgi:hypothetical protein